MTIIRGQVAREHTPLSVALAAQIKQARGERQLSQQQMAARADMAFSTYRRIESGDRPPTFGQVEAVAHALGMAASELIRRAEDQVPAAREQAPVRPARVRTGRTTPPAPRSSRSQSGKPS